MTTDLKTTAQQCLDAAYTDAMIFPKIVGTLIEAGFESYLIDWRQKTATYYLPNGDCFSLPLPHHGTEHASATIAPELDVDVLTAAIREAQTQAPGYSYEGFCTKVQAGGCAGYIVSFSGKRAVYFGRTGEVHTEHFPGAK